MFKDGKELAFSKFTSVHLDASYYREIGIKKENYLAISVLDRPSFDISQFFESTARFIDSAIFPTDKSASCGSDSSALHKEAANSGKVVVHCVAGRSRSATIVIAYLLLRARDPFPSLEEAIRFVKSRRDISPYNEFLKQLMQLERQIQFNRQKSALEQIKHLGEEENTPQVQVTRLTEAANCCEPILQLNKKTDKDPQWFHFAYWFNTNTYMLSIIIFETLTEYFSFSD